MSGIYTDWDWLLYRQYLEKFELPKDKRLKDFSKGMKVKLAFAVALSHKAELLILDEATSGLDPIIRDDVLDMLIDFVQDESHSVLVSSHITSDLEKVADYITFIHKDKLIFTHEKADLLDNYGLLNCGAATFDTLDKSEIIAYRKEDYQFKVLVKDRNKAAKQHVNAIVGPATIEEIMLFYVKGEMQYTKTNHIRAHDISVEGGWFEKHNPKTPHGKQANTNGAGVNSQCFPPDDLCYLI